MRKMRMSMARSKASISRWLVVFQQPVAAEQPVGILGEQPEQFELAGPQRDFLASESRQSSRFQVEQALPMRTRGLGVAASAPPALRRTALIRANSARGSYGLAM